VSCGMCAVQLHVRYVCGFLNDAFAIVEVDTLAHVGVYTVFAGYPLAYLGRMVICVSHDCMLWASRIPSD
jgi:hypothetical protein